jgi:hypothetical protein
MFRNAVKFGAVRWGQNVRDFVFVAHTVEKKN